MIACLLAAVLTAASHSITEPPLATTAFAAQTHLHRGCAGLDPYELDDDLAEYAASHTAEMVAAGELYHSPDGRLQAIPGSWARRGENVGRGVSAGSLFEAFQASPTHQELLMDPHFTSFGIASERSDRLYVTFIFEEAA